MREYLLIPRGRPSDWDALTPEDWARLNEAFAAWTATLRAEDHYVRGSSLPETLKLVRRMTPRTFAATHETRSDDENALTGFFLIRAETYEQAVEFASSCPSLMHDRIEVYEL